MPYYEIEVEARRCVCVKADNEEDAIQTAIDETTMCDWSQAEGRVEDEYGDGTDPEAAKFIAEYKRDHEYYETQYNEDYKPE
jgi:hypothetical protein